MKVRDLDRRVEYDCIIGFEGKLMIEWWTIDNGGRGEDIFVAKVVSVIVTRRALEQVSKVS